MKTPSWEELVADGTLWYLVQDQREPSTWYYTAKKYYVVDKWDFRDKYDHCSAIAKYSKQAKLRKFMGYLKKHYPYQNAPVNVDFLWKMFTAKQSKPTKNED